MQKILRVIAAIASMLAASCGASPTAPPPVLAEQAPKPSSQADLLLIRVEKDGGTVDQPMQKVTLGENLSKGMSASQMPASWTQDWNGANLSLVRICDGRETQQTVQFPGQGKDPVTGKILTAFPAASTCGGTQVSFRLRANNLLLSDRTRTTAYTDFDLPDRNLLALPAGFNIIKENGKSFIRGTLQ